MNKANRDNLLPLLKQLPTEELQRGLLNGFMTASFCPASDTKSFRYIGEQMFLIKKELKSRGIQTIRVDTILGTRIAFKPIPDKKKDSPLAIHIPTPSQLIRGPIAPDLPKHGYLGSGPTIYL